MCGKFHKTLFQKESKLVWIKERSRGGWNWVVYTLSILFNYCDFFAADFQIAVLANRSSIGRNLCLNGMRFL